MAPTWAAARGATVRATDGWSSRMSPTPRFVRRLTSAPVGAEQRLDPTAISLCARQGAAPPPRG
eukprot:4926748-Prymnesium_polylepis.1